MEKIFFSPVGRSVEELTENEVVWSREVRETRFDADDARALREALIELVRTGPVKLATSAMFGLSLHERTPELVDLAAEVLRGQLPDGDPHLLFQALIALDNWGHREWFEGVTSWAVFEVEENRRRAAAWLAKHG